MAVGGVLVYGIITAAETPVGLVGVAVLVAETLEGVAIAGMLLGGGAYQIYKGVKTINEGRREDTKKDNTYDAISGADPSKEKRNK